jgi:hypothetical protein
MIPRRIELISAFIAFVLGSVWIVLLAHDFRVLASDTAAVGFTGAGIDLSPPMGWAGVTVYCLGAAIAVCAVPTGVCLHLWRDRLLGLRFLLLATGVLACAVLFYVLAPDRFWVPQVLAGIEDRWYVVVSTLALVFAMTATTAGLDELWLPDRLTRSLRVSERAADTDLAPGNPNPAQ